MPQKSLRMTWREGNRVALLHDGVEFFPALCRAIDQARRVVHVETYMFRMDDTGLTVLDHLRRARARGVKVRVLIDGFGCGRDAVRVHDALVQMGAQCRIYRPQPKGLRNYWLDPTRLRRLHRKLAMVDRRIAFVGGINIVDDLDPALVGNPSPRFDFAVSLQGPIVIDVARTMARLWLRFSWRRPGGWAAFYERVGDWAARRVRNQFKHAPTFQPGMRAALLLRDNLRNRQTIEGAYLQAIDQARHDIVLANAYFFPGRRLRAALARAAARGVRVRLLLQGLSEYAIQYRACRTMYRRMLDDGIEVYEYTASYLHAKVAVFDRQAMVGSSNLDPFSLLLAREANVLVDAPAFADDLRRSLEAALDQRATRVTPRSLARQSLACRVLDNVSYVLLRLGVTLTGRSARF
jgi:cardiolipin synthase